MSTSAVDPGDPGDLVGTNAVSVVADPSPMNRPPVFDCVYAYAYQCAVKVARAGTKCSKCLVRATEPSIVDIQSEL